MGKFPKTIFSYIEDGDTILINGEAYQLFEYIGTDAFGRGFQVLGLAKNQKEFDEMVDTVYNLNTEEGEGEA